MERARLAIVAACLALGCHDSNERISLGNADSGTSVVAHVGDTLEVTLQTIGPGQYGTPSVSSPSVRFIGESPAGEPNPGGPRQLFRFQAAADGQAIITIPHEGQIPNVTASPFELTVAVY